jgi:signal transduction histidine kinase
MIESFKRVFRRYWPRLRLRTILLLTFLFVAALPGVGALFLRVYENTLVRQTEAELIAQGAALAAAAARDWPGGKHASDQTDYQPEPPAIDLRLARILPERPAPRVPATAMDSTERAWAAGLDPVMQQTARTTLASIMLLDRSGRIATGPKAGWSLAAVDEVAAALRGKPATVLRHNANYQAHYAFEWLSRASDLRIHHARPVIVDGKVVGVLLLARSPRALFVGIYADRGKIALGVLLIFVALVVLSGLLSRGIVRPIEQLGEATRAVARGGRTIPAPPNTAAIEIQSLYRDFAAMAEAIDLRSRYLRDFAHAMSHEFKTPLAGITGAVELLQDHPEMTAEDRARFLSNVAGDAVRLNRLVSRLLELARADMTEANAVAVADLASVLRRLADAYGGNDLTVTLEDGHSLPQVRVPEAVLEAIMTTLIANSRQAGATAITITGWSTGDTVELRVQDNGTGIPAGDCDRIFEPFFTSQRNEGGTGLGLPIARSLLRAYHASIRLDTAGDGTSFQIILPVG